MTAGEPPGVGPGGVGGVLSHKGLLPPAAGPGPAGAASGARCPVPGLPRLGSARRGGTGPKAAKAGVPKNWRKKSRRLVSHVRVHVPRVVVPLTV